MDQDIVYVSPRKTTIPVSGNVLRPGYYEILKDENLGKVIDYAGGLNRKSSNFIFLYRGENFNNDGFLVNNEQFNDFMIFNGDSIHVPQNKLS